MLVTLPSSVSTGQEQHGHQHLYPLSAFIVPIILTFTLFKCTFCDRQTNESEGVLKNKTLIMKTIFFYFSDPLSILFYMNEAWTTYSVPFMRKKNITAIFFYLFLFLFGLCKIFNISLQEEVSSSELAVYQVFHTR